LNDEKVAVMNVRDRLVLSSQPGNIALIRKGFLHVVISNRCFLYSVCNKKSKYWVGRFKNLEGQWVFYAGFPTAITILK
jgi:hypothetical protein